MSTNSRQAGLNEQLVQACIDFNIIAIEQFLKEGADPNFLTVRDYIEDKHFYEPYLKTSLDIVLCKYLSKSEEEVTKVAKLLLDFGANPAGGANSEYVSSPLHKAVEAENFSLVQLLVERGADVNALDYNDGAFSPLHIACFNLAPAEIVEYLVLHGADINILNEDGETAINVLVRHAPNLQYKSIEQQLEILIQNGADLFITDRLNENAWTQMQNHPELKLAAMNAVLKNDFDKQPVLKQQIIEMLPKFNINNIDELKEVLNEKISLSMIDEIIESQLVLLHPDNLLEHKLIQAAVDLNVDKMSALLEEGANPNFMLPEYYYPYENKSALHRLADDYSIYSVNHNVTLSGMKLLLEHGANPNLANEQGNTVLHIMQYKIYPYFIEDASKLEAFYLLLNHGADLHQKNLDGNSPADYLSKQMSHFDTLFGQYKPASNLSDIIEENAQDNLLVEEIVAFKTPEIIEENVEAANYTDAVNDTIPVEFDIEMTNYTDLMPNATEIIEAITDIIETTNQSVVVSDNTETEIVQISEVKSQEPQSWSQWAAELLTPSNWFHSKSLPEIKLSEVLKTTNDIDFDLLPTLENTATKLEVLDNNTTVLQVYVPQQEHSTFVATQELV